MAMVLECEVRETELVNNDEEARADPLWEMEAQLRYMEYLVKEGLVNKNGARCNANYVNARNIAFAQRVDIRGFPKNLRRYL